jgi:dCMP deaminase
MAFMKHDASEWDSIFFQTATLWSRRSHDTQTQCGCVLVKEKAVLSTGYNGFIRDIDDTVLPRTRPEKYPFMIHAEANAIYNAARMGRSTLDTTAYITGAPCIDCLQMLFQCGVYDIRFSDISNPKNTFANREYMKLVDLIEGQINLTFIPKSSINKANLVESFEEMK